MLEASSSNPYDFRSPIRNMSLLAGRLDELERINALLRDAAAGRPTHLSIFGAVGCGKSSLLNAVVSIAKARNLLPVKVTLRAAIVASEIAFYEAVVDAGLQALIEMGVLELSGPEMEAWMRQTRAGDAGFAVESTTFEVGLLAASALSGRAVRSVPIPAFQRDLDRLVVLGSARHIRGVVLCLDAAEYLDDNRDIAQSLAAVAGTVPNLALVTASETATKLQQVNERSWDQMEVKALVGAPAVFEAMARPLEFAEERGMVPDLDTAQDVYSLTRGHPYEVNLVCHFVWEAIRAGEQDGFRLSTSVIERVLTELEEKGRHSSSTAISVLAELSSSDYEALARVAPYESMTTRQLALVRLMLEDFTTERLDEVLGAVDADLQLLRDRGVLRLEADRFSLLGGSDARLYAKYAAQRAAGLKIRYGASYAQRATFRCGDKIGEALVGQAYPDAIVRAGGVPHELGGTQPAGRWLNQLCDAARDGDIPTLAAFLRIPVDEATLTNAAKNGLVLFGTLLQIGVNETEHVELLVNEPEIAADEAVERGRVWVDATAEVRALYDVEVLDHRVHVLPPDLGRDLLVYHQLVSASRISFLFYRGGMAEQALTTLNATVVEAESVLDEGAQDPLVRSQFAEALSRLGFMSATLQRFEEAKDFLDRSADTALEVYWLQEFNRAYVAACLGDLEVAAQLGQAAFDHMSDSDSVVLLHADFAAPEGFGGANPRWNVVELNGSWVKRFVRLQTAVWRARSAQTQTSELVDELDGISRSSPLPLLRLAAWAELLVASRADEAKELFERVVELAAVDQQSEMRDEADRALLLVAGADTAAEPLV